MFIENKKKKEELEKELVSLTDMVSTLKINLDNGNLKLNENEYYTVACIDYMMLHKNTYRKYNYFSSYKESNVEYILKEYPNEVIENYLLENKTISINQFMSSNYTCISN